jgi:hypothetical protein
VSSSGGRLDIVDRTAAGTSRAGHLRIAEKATESAWFGSHVGEADCYRKDDSVSTDVTDFAGGDGPGRTRVN